MTPQPPLLQVRGLRVMAGKRTIVDGIDLEARKGETIGIVGESGSGKSMTARALLGLLPRGLHAEGSVEVAGRNLLALRERELRRVRGSRVSLLFQDPFTMLNPLQRTWIQVTETSRDPAGRPLARRERRADAVRRLAEVGIADPTVAERYPFQLSGGMRQRVGIAAALASDPAVLIADEPTTALDVTTQGEILRLLRTLQQRRGLTLILITHDLRIAFSMCDTVHVLYAGSIVEQGPGLALEREPRHPYTLGLLTAEPPVDRRLTRLNAIEGAVPPPDDVLDRCSFADRCAWRMTVCVTSKPPLIPAGEGRLSACRRVGEIAADLELRREAFREQAHVPASSRTPTPLVQVERLGKVFRGRRGSVQALLEVSFAIGAGESVGLVGESGSGKTTLARCLLGLETPDSGRIEICGTDVSSYRALTAAQRARVRSAVQIVFQDPYSTLNPARTVGGTLHEAIAVGPTPRTSVGALLERVGLPPAYAHRKPVALSGGERQRVAIARALAVRPSLIVCDEPVSSLDVSVQAQILNLLASVREETGISYLFITHDLAVVRQMVERVFVLRQGVVVEAGPVDDVLDRPQHAYTQSLVASVPRMDSEWLDERRIV